MLGLTVELQLTGGVGPLRGCTTLYCLKVTLENK